jgi:uncharacterized protein involved in type VI secretion and phage assembly
MTPGLEAMLQGDRRPEPLHGVVTAVVTNNQDEAKLGRVKVRFKWLSPDDESAWARIAVPMAGKQSGTYFLPDVDDEVLVAFEQGDVRFPYVLGSLWRSGAEPPQANDDGANGKREIRTPEGLSVLFDDAAKSIVIADADGKAMVTVSDGKVTIEASGAIEIKSTGDAVKLEGANVEITGKTGLKLEAPQLKLNGSATVEIKGGLIQIG